MNRLALIPTLCLLIVLTLSSAATAHETQEYSKDSHIEQATEQQDFIGASSLRLSAVALLMGFGTLGIAAVQARPSNLVIWGGVAGLIGGATRIVLGVLPALPVNHPASEFAGRTLSSEASTLLGPVGALLSTAALASLYALLGRGSLFATKGIILAYLSATTLAIAAALGSFLGWEQLYGSLGLAQAVGWVWTIGFLLISIASFRSGVLGRWRFLPLVLFLLATPLPRILITSLSDEPQTVFLLLPGVAGGLGWILLSCLLFRSAAKLSAIQEPVPSS